MQKLQLSIPEPCHENWQQMTPTEQGRFCNACAKEVIDFSSMTDIQVLNYFINVPHEKICGRALPEQLDRPISSPEPPKKRLFWHWNYFVMFFMFFAKGNNATAQSNTKPATELSPGDNLKLRGQMIASNGDEKESDRIISGKVISQNETPIPFATIKIKGFPTGISADANGAYTIRKIKLGAVLEISASGYVKMEISIGTQSNISTVLLKNIHMGEAVVAFAGRISYQNVDGNIVPTKITKFAVLKVKDLLTEKVVHNASIIITGKSSTDTIFTDQNGACKIRTAEGHQFYIKVLADGYEPNEFTIDAQNFEDRKKEWEVLLRKQKTEPVQPLLVKTVTQKTIRLGGMIAVNKSIEPLYVVDGIPTKKANDIKPEDIDNISILKTPEATLLYGTDGTNGAIVITTKKLKVKNLDTVSISAGLNRRVNAKMLGGMTAGYTATYLADTKAKLMTILTDSLKVYPNPVQRNSTFSLSLKLKEAGTYQIQFKDATGKIILQKIINTVGKNHVEMLQSQNWAAGIYYVRVFNKNKLISNTSFIVD
jgi:TonB-dependent SusC/RagA subfamily outer membrane receptor